MDYRALWLLAAAGILRCVLVGVGVYHDQNSRLKYTDVDYQVFRDGARYMAEGQSPFSRSTFRYSPLLALILLPSVAYPLWGKVLFGTCDLLCGALLWKLLVLRGSDGRWAALWLMNPLVLGISTRGSCDALQAALVLATLLMLQNQTEKKPKLQNQIRTKIKSRRENWMVFGASVLFGLAVHMRLYPITYSLPMVLSLGLDQNLQRETEMNPSLSKTTPTCWKSSAFQILTRFFSKDMLIFALGSSSVFLSLGLLFYCIYGEQFLDQWLLFHLLRKDIRHNFSPFFYLLYLSTALQSEECGTGSVLGLAVLLPQLLLLIAASLAFRSDLPFCCYTHTHILVSFNKICTSQYFVWYLCFLPLLCPRLSLGWTRALVLVLLWFLGQALWLLPAYLLEFEGMNSFFFIWMASLLFLIINCFVLGQIVTHYTPLQNTHSVRRHKAD